MYQERCEEARAEFRQKIALYKPSQLIYIDESGIDSNEIYPYGWSKKGERFWGSRPGKKRERLSIIGALCEDKFFAPMVYQGYCTAKLITAWLEQFLLPQVQPGQVIIMDNAPFHNSHPYIKISTVSIVYLKIFLGYDQTCDYQDFEQWN